MYTLIPPHDSAPGRVLYSASMTDSPAHESSHRDHEEAAGQDISAGFAIVTFSDTRTEETDRSGALLREAITAAGHHVTRYTIVSGDSQ